MSLPTPCEPAAPATLFLRSAPAIDVQHGALAGENARLEVAAASSPGRRHEINEDSHSALDGPLPLYVVADGVGGGAMASRASRELVSRVHSHLRHARLDDHALREALLDADVEVARSIASQTDAMGAATVALCAATSADFGTWLVAWVGDCRVYRIGRRGEAQLLTRDDTYRHLDEAPPDGGSPDDPARMLGNGAVIAPNVEPVALDLDAMLVLCSDGVHAHVDEHDLGEALTRSDLPLAQRCADLVRLARERGSSDDATLLAVHRTSPQARPTALLRSHE